MIYSDPERGYVFYIGLSKSHDDRIAKIESREWQGLRFQFYIATHNSGVSYYWLYDANHSSTESSNTKNTLKLFDLKSNYISEWVNFGWHSSLKCSTVDGDRKT